MINLKNIKKRTDAKTHTVSSKVDLDTKLWLKDFCKSQGPISESALIEALIMAYKAERCKKS